jgi:predicted ATPase/DNA-binding NarL/FixJ family response regulator
MVKPHRESHGTPRKTPPRARGTLPFTLLSDPTPLIGRDRELEVVRQHMLGETVRLLTLTGPGGVGKTRLALAAARSVEGAFPDGAWFVDLVPVRDPTHIDATIAHALHLEEVGTRSSRDRVTAYLRTRHVLLVLDNFEHVLPAATRVGELLATCPYLKVLATSREPLNLRLEHRFPLAGLALPNLRVPDLAAVALVPSGALFLEHARRVQPDFGLTPGDARDLAALLHRLDGIPLAIRIAAVHSHVLSPAAMLARLQGQALLSTEQARDVPARHHTLRDAIDWSFGLLGVTGQAGFRQLGVFAGGWTLEGAEAVLQDPEPASPVWAILGLLVDKSLVQATTLASDDWRYSLLQPVREYALARLQESGEVDAARDRHAAYYLALAERAEPALWGPEEGTWVRRLEAEHENFRAALRWAAERNDGELSLRLAGALADFWAWRGYLREGRRWLEEARVLGAAAPPLLRAKALAGEGHLARLQGDYPQARALLQNALALAEVLRDPALTAGVLWRLGRVVALQGDASEARALLERSVALGREAGDVRDTAIALVHLGRHFVLLEDLERAESAITEALELGRGTGSALLMAWDLTIFAQLKLWQRDTTGAASLASEALRLAIEGRRGITYVVMIVAFVSEQRGDVERAVRLLATVDAWSDLTGEVVSFTYYDPAAYAVLHARARQQLGDVAYHAAVAEARTLSLDQAADLARASLEPLLPRGPAGTTAGAERPRAFLSDREQAVLRLVAEGLFNKQIATSLGLGERTVKAHLSSAMNKLGVDNRAHAAVSAVQRGLL